jgi:hypothetical protein
MQKNYRKIQKIGKKIFILENKKAHWRSALSPRHCPHPGEGLGRGRPDVVHPAVAEPTERGRLVAAHQDAVQPQKIGRLKKLLKIQKQLIF